MTIARAASAECLKIAKIIWHRFATDSVEFWEDETHQAEYLDCANHILEDIAPQPATVAQPVIDPRDLMAKAWLYGHCAARGFSFSEIDYEGCRGSKLWHDSLFAADWLASSVPSTDRGGK
jgi:hypothetical protein